MSSQVFPSIPEYHSCSCLYAYISSNQEVRTQKIISVALTDGKAVTVPKVTGDKTGFRYIHSVEECRTGTMGISEPEDRHEPAAGKDKEVLMLMP